jgi:hypothetical protein
VPSLCHPNMKPFRGHAARCWILLWSVVVLPACGRTGLDADGLLVGLDDQDDAGAIRAPLAEASAGAQTDVPCVPSPEICNGVDDDCNGRIDDGLASIACPGGGARYCVAGRWSACPVRCSVCIPGSEVVCFHSYCLYWGVKTCAADGQGFGPCREDRPPPECASTARDKKDSPELERCCADHGYCCTDDHDIDGDGNRNELVGTCGGVVCTQ